eukprot:EG_transcript_20687
MTPVKATSTEVETVDDNEDRLMGTEGRGQFPRGVKGSVKKRYLSLSFGPTGPNPHQIPHKETQSQYTLMQTCFRDGTAFLWSFGCHNRWPALSSDSQQASLCDVSHNSSRKASGQPGELKCGMHCCQNYDSITHAIKVLCQRFTALNPAVTSLNSR